MLFTTKIDKTITVIVYTKNCMLASSKSVHCFSSLSRKLDVGWPTELKTFNYEVIPVWIMYNTAFVIYTLGWGTVDKQQLHFLLNATPTSTPRQEVRKGTRVYELRMRNCSPWHTACSGSPHNALHSSSYDSYLNCTLLDVDKVCITLLFKKFLQNFHTVLQLTCLLYTSPSPRD